MEEDYQEEGGGSCPNCGKSVYISEMGSENGTICCKYCYEEVRNIPPIV